MEYTVRESHVTRDRRRLELALRGNLGADVSLLALREVD